MFVPTRCPRCRSAEDWHEVENLFRGFRFGGLKIRLTRGFHPETVKYRCEKCGYEAEYDDHAETLGR